MGHEKNLESAKPIALNAYELRAALGMGKVELRRRIKSYPQTTVNQKITEIHKSYRVGDILCAQEPKKHAKIFMRVIDLRLERLQRVTIPDEERENYPWAETWFYVIKLERMEDTD